MAIDPRNYDIDELRSTSADEPSLDREKSVEWPGRFRSATRDMRGRSPMADESTDRPAAAAAFEDSVKRDLVLLDREADGIERPYLTALPASMAAEALIFEWLEFLLLQAGQESVADALTFYERVGWLGTDAADTLGLYLSGLDDDRANDDNDLDPDDHRVSLQYVARLSVMGE